MITPFKTYFKIVSNDKYAKIGFITLIFLVFISSFSFLSPYDPNAIDTSSILEKPSLTHIFGTDEVGRDYFTRALYGGRVSLLIGFSSMAVSLVVGTLLGTISGYFGGIIDSIIMRTIDIIMSIPSLFIILVINMYIKPSMLTFIFIIGLFSWMDIARIVRSEVLSLKEREYVLYSISLGASTNHIIRKHILSNIINTVIVTSNIKIANAILMESALSFLGLGIQPPTPSWGNMLKNAQSHLLDLPTMAIFPGVLIVITVLCFNFIGDSLSKKH